MDCRLHPSEKNCTLTISGTEEELLNVAVRHAVRLVVPLRVGSFALTKEAPGSYFIFVRAVGLKVLKNKLSEYIRLAAGGETILVTDRNHVVAEISPPGATRAQDLPDVLLAEAVRKGWLKPALISQATPPPRLPVNNKTFRSVMNELQRDREGR